MAIKVAQPSDSAIRGRSARLRPLPEELYVEVVDPRRAEFYAAGAGEIQEFPRQTHPVAWNIYHL